MAYRVQLRRGTASQWSTENPILLEGEFAIETDTKKFKIGDGITTWNNLPYATQGEAGKSLQYVWDGTRLGIKREGETSYTYVDLKGDEGKPGTTTWEGITDKPTEFMPIPHEHDILYYKKETVDTKLNAKVDKVANKGLSTNDYTDTEKAKNQKNADNISNLQNVRIYEGTTQPTDTRFWYDPTEMGRFKIIEDGTPRKTAWKDEVDSLAGEGRTTETVKDNADKIGVLTEKVNPVAPLNTTSQDLSGAVNEIKDEIDTNKQEYDQNKQETQLKVLNVEKELNDYKRTLQQVNVNHEAKQLASGYGTISLPPNTANGQVSVSVRGETVTNLLGDDGDFRNDLGEWEKVAIDGVNISNNEMTITCNADYGYSRMIHKVDFIVGHKYAMLYELKNITGEEIRIELGGSRGKATSVSTSKFERYCLTVNFDTDMVNEIRFGFPVNSPTEGNIAQLKLRNVMVIDLTELGDENLSKDELLQKYPFISNTKSTISASRLKSVGKNLFDINSAKGDSYVKVSKTLDNGLIIDTTATGGQGVSKIIPNMKFKPNTPYTMSYNGVESVDTKNLRLSFIYTDGTELTMPSATLTPTNYFRTSELGKTISHISYRMSTTEVGTLTIKNIQIEEGTVATPYEPYTESTSYLPNVGELRSLPNGTKDEVRVSEGKLIRNIKDYIIQSSDLTSKITASNNVERMNTSTSFLALANKQGWANNRVTGSLKIEGWPEKPYADSLDNISTFYTQTDGSITFLFAKGTTLTQARQQLTGLTLTYQLAEPEIIPVEVSGNIVAHPNGTIYIEPVVADANVYNDGIIIFEQELNIDYIDKIAKVDYVTGVETPLDISKAVIAEDKKSFTHPDLMNGDMVFFEYFYSNESTQGEATVEYYDSRYVIPDKTLPDKYYKWDIEVDNGVPNVTVTEV